MAGAKFQYDESGGTFFYFLLSFLALVVIPCTYYFWPRDKKKDEESRDRQFCHCERCAIKNSLLRAKEPWRNVKRRVIKLLLLLGWAAMFATAYKVANIQHDYVAWDPFEILQIDPASSMADIKKAYRRLSLIYHPDKEQGDERKFMMIAKAYAALTDEEARKNWEMYGNPDGPGATSFGIALPSWIVEKENSVLVLGLYALVFMVALPVAVGVWWYRSAKFGSDQVLLETTRLYYVFIHRTPHMVMRRLIMVIAASMEFDKNHNSEIIERSSDNIEVPQLIKELQNLGEKNKERPLCYLYSIKARALLYAHLSRMKLPPNTLEQDKMYIVKKCPYLLQEFVQCVAQLIMLALAQRIPRTPHLDTVENAMRFSPMVVQALWEKKSSLLQLPHITEDILRHFTTRKRNIRTLRQLASMKSDERRALLRTLTDDQYDDVMNVLSRMPVLEVEVRSEVLDDEDSGTITARAIVTVTVTLIRRTMQIYLGQENEEPEMEDTVAGLEQNHVQQVNKDSSQVKKTKVWEKQKKKPRGRGGNKGKKKPNPKAALSNGKKAQNQPDVVTSAQIGNTEAKHQNCTKASGDSRKGSSQGFEDGEVSDSDSVAGSSHSGSVAGDKDDVSEKSSQKNETNERTDDEEDEEWEKFQHNVTKKERVLETKSKKSHIVHCPYFPDDKQEYWWIYIADRKRWSLVTVPYLMTNLVDTEEVELKFTAPTKPGFYTYHVMVRSDSYIDCDQAKVIKLDVKEAKEVDIAHPQWDISDDEEERNEDESAVEDSDLASDDDQADD